MDEKFVSAVKASVKEVGDYAVSVGVLKVRLFNGNVPDELFVKLVEMTVKASFEDGVLKSVLSTLSATWSHEGTWRLVCDESGISIDVLI